MPGLIGRLDGKFNQIDRFLPDLPSEPLADWSAPTIDLVPAVFWAERGIVPPVWLSPYGQAWDMVPLLAGQIKTEVELVVTVPPQHGKTLTTITGLLRATQLAQGLSHAYASYNATRTYAVERQARRVAESAGLVIEGNRDEWFLPETQSRIRWTSVDGTLSGDPVSGALVIDDPYKGFAEAKSAAVRTQVHEFVHSVAKPRLHPGAMLFLVTTRYHVDDQAARMIKDGVSVLNLQAICEQDNDPLRRPKGAALWPEGRSLQLLNGRRKANPFLFAALYQGLPRPLGETLFGDPHRFVDLPRDLAYRVGYGLDLAYTKTTISDWSVILRGRWCDGKLYLVHCARRQTDAPHFKSTILGQLTVARGPLRWYYGGGGERGVADFVALDVPGLDALPATTDKVVRSTSAREAWNLGRILVPSEDSPHFGPWVESFLDEIGIFSGIGDRNDDQVDALAALWDLMAGVGGPREADYGEGSVIQTSPQVRYV